MTAPDSQSGIYQPFPSFVDWELSGFEVDAFERYADLLGVAKENATADSLESAFTAARRYAAVDTNAIEGIYSVDRGFTRTIATQAAAWEAMMDARGGHVRPAFNDALDAYEYVLDAATQSVEITEVWIKELHQLICRSQDGYEVFTPAGPQKQELPKGRYKTMPNSPTLTDGRIHAYAPVHDTAPEMQRLIGELRSEAFLSAHPVLQAAYAHYAYVCIHPFADGNGRVARALSSVFLYRRPGVPLIVFADQRNEYYDALARADERDPLPFIQFVMTRTIDSIGIIRSMLLRSSSPTSKTVEGLRDIFGRNTINTEVSAAGARLRDLVIAQAKSYLNTLDLPRELGPTVGRALLMSMTVPDGYQPLGKDGSLTLSVQCNYPKQVSAFYPIHTFVKRDDSGVSDFIMRSKDGKDLEVWLRELRPVVTETLKLKVESYVEAAVESLLLELQQKLN